VSDLVDRWTDWGLERDPDKKKAAEEWCEAYLRKNFDPRLASILMLLGTNLSHVNSILQQNRAPMKRLLEENEALKAQIKALEARPIGVIDRGVWQAGDTYKAHEGASHAGSFWICQRMHTADPDQPGTSGQWRLAVKRGRDGRDLRVAP
jgi:hypothetical protein